MSHTKPIGEPARSLAADALTLRAIERSGAAARPGVDWRFVGRGLASATLFALALGCAAAAWTFTPAAGLIIGVPIVYAFGRDRARFPLIAWNVIAFFAFALLRSLPDQLGIGPYAGYAIAMDRAMGFGAIPTVWLQTHLRHPFVDVAMAGLYHSLFLAPFVAAVLIWRRDDVLRRFVLALTIAYACALAVFVLVPTVPPWMASAFGSIEPIDRIYVDVMKPLVPQLMEAGYRASANDVAAMPSMHMGVALLASLAIARLGRAGRLAGTAYAVAMFFGIVYLGEHYVVDGLAGCVLAYAIWRSVP